MRLFGKPEVVLDFLLMPDSSSSLQVFLLWHNINKNMSYNSWPALEFHFYLLVFSLFFFFCFAIFIAVHQSFGIALAVHCMLLFQGHVACCRKIINSTPVYKDGGGWGDDPHLWEKRDLNFWILLFEYSTQTWKICDSFLELTTWIELPFVTLLPGFP